MAIQNPPERPRRADTADDYREAKAAANAAKAYAKSQRPWYKKKRWWAAGLLLIVIIASAGGGAGSDNSKPTASPNTSQNSQSEKPGANEEAAAKKEPAATKEPEMTSGQANALRSGESYLDGQPFSKQGLIRQLKFEGYSKSDATFAANHVDANWNKEAVESAKSYLRGQAFSRSALIEQLEFEKFTPAQARYAASRVY